MATRITVLVDDRKGLPALATEHGLAFWVEHDGRKLLVDTGASGQALLRNAEALGIAVEEAEAIALSHGHFDHTGGLAAVAPRLGGVDLYAHPDVFVRKYTKSTTGAWHSIGIAFAQTQLEAAGIFCRLSTGAQEVVPGAWLTGEVPRDARCVPSTPHLYADNPVGRIIDPFHDDQALVLRGADGFVVVSGCAHSGIVNLCRAAQQIANPRRLLGQGRLRAVVGGFHLGNASPELLQATIEGLRALDPEAIHPCHCTGEPATRALTEAFPHCCKPIAAGSVLEF
ncbi:MAG TPA: MBL fold metallo-hydrolase [Planctomycetota bacterium]|nr:MBL fold metallo-hydrolase [Planctomycetota bacterium]